MCDVWAGRSPMLSRSFLSMYISSSWCYNTKNTSQVTFPVFKALALIRSSYVRSPVCCSLLVFPGSGGEPGPDLQSSSSRGFVGRQHSLRKHWRQYVYVQIQNVWKPRESIKKVQPQGAQGLSGIKAFSTIVCFVLGLILWKDSYQQHHPLGPPRPPWGALLVGLQHRCMLGRRLGAAVTCGESECVLLCSLHLDMEWKKWKITSGFIFLFLSSEIFLFSHLRHWPMSGQTTRSLGAKSSSCGSCWRRRRGWQTDGAMPGSPLLLLTGLMSDTTRTDTGNTTCYQGTELSITTIFSMLQNRMKAKSCMLCLYYVCVAGSPTFFLLLRRRAACGLVAGLLSHGNGRDDAGLATQTPLLLLLLQVLQDVLSPLVGARHRPRRKGFLEGRRAWRVDQTAQT